MGVPKPGSVVTWSAGTAAEANAAAAAMRDAFNILQNKRIQANNGILPYKYTRT